MRRRAGGADRTQTLERQVLLTHRLAAFRPAPGIDEALAGGREAFNVSPTRCCFAAFLYGRTRLRSGSAPPASSPVVARQLIRKSAVPQAVGVQLELFVPPQDFPVLGERQR